MQICFFSTDMMMKILRVSLKIKDHVFEITERLDKIEDSFSAFQNKNNSADHEIEIENIYLDYFPIKNEEDLNEFERKLSERTFRSSVVS